MVGSPQDIQCTVSTVSGVELNLVMISWIGHTIRNDSRVTISPTSGSGNNYTSSIQFMYLMEGDEGTYECNVMILDTSISKDFELKNLTGILFIVPKFISKLFQTILIYARHPETIERTVIEWSPYCLN